MDITFNELYNLNVNDKTEKKNGLTFLSWAYAWAELKKRFPDAVCNVYENPEMGGLPYFTDGKTAMVKVGIQATRGQHEHIEWLPVMRNAKMSIPLEQITTFDINTSIQRAATKAIAKAVGIGLYLYAGEDLPEEELAEKTEQLRNAQPKVDRSILETQVLFLAGGDAEKLDKACQATYGGKNFKELTDDELLDCKQKIIKKNNETKK